MNKIKRIKRLERQQSLLQEFSGQEYDHYEEKKIGDNWYIKSWNGGTKRWQVAIYKPASYNAYKGYKGFGIEINENIKEVEEMDSLFSSLIKE